MAIIWEKTLNNNLYQVRTAGKTVRLYTNGVLHSQYHPDKVLTESVWDLLGLPALLLRKKVDIRILVLGVGGGAVFHFLDKLVQPWRIVGIDVSAVHLQLAKQFFDLRRSHYGLYQADAIEWVKAYRGPRFDMVIDDLFIESDKLVRRVVPMDKSWMTELQRLIKPHGLLVGNFASKKECNQALILKGRKEGDMFSSCLQLTTANCENIVGVFSQEKLLIGDLKSRISQHEALATEKLRYRVSKR